MFKRLVITLHGITRRFAVGKKRESIVTLDGRGKKASRLYIDTKSFELLPV